MTREEAIREYDTQKYTQSPSVGIEDVARVQFASHAKVFDKKRKAVFDWEQFKEVAGIFYGFGKKDSPEAKEKEQPDKSLEEAAKEYATTHLRNNEFPTADSAFIAGAERQKEQMMDEAVEGEIVYSGFDDGTVILRAIIPDRRYDKGDKVRIIVLPKEDEK